MSSAFALTDIHMRFMQGSRELDVLDGASLEIAAGEVVALVGPSGSGKSTLLHIAGLLEKPDSGDINLNGAAIAKNDDAARTALRLKHIGFVYQFHNLLPEFTAQENIAMPLRLNGQERKEAEAQAADFQTVSLSSPGERERAPAAALPPGCPRPGSR